MRRTWSCHLACRLFRDPLPVGRPMGSGDHSRPVDDRRVSRLCACCANCSILGFDHGLSTLDAKGLGTRLSLRSFSPLDLFLRILSEAEQAVFLPDCYFVNALCADRRPTPASPASPFGQARAGAQCGSRGRAAGGGRAGHRAVGLVSHYPPGKPPQYPSSPDPLDTDPSRLHLRSPRGGQFCATC